MNKTSWQLLCFALIVTFSLWAVHLAEHFLYIPHEDSRFAGVAIIIFGVVSSSIVVSKVIQASIYAKPFTNSKQNPPNMLS